MKKITRKIISIAAVLAIAALTAWVNNNSDSGDSVATSRDNNTVSSRGDAAVRQAFTQRKSKVWVNGVGTVERTLSDDNEGSRHQRFILRTSDGQSLMFAHNIDLAKRVPLKRGDSIEYRGMYEWNEKGGVIHWTHHDPENRFEGGYIDYKGTTYR